MAKRYLFFAALALFMIVAVTILGPMAAFTINPEIAAGHADYVRNYQLLNSVKLGILATSVLIDCGLWLACCAFLIKARSRSLRWLPLALLGPPGLAVLTLLKNGAPDNADPCQRSIDGMRPLARIVCEVTFFVVVCVAAGLAIMLWNDLSIGLESMRTGVSFATLLEQRSASGGMWAFGDLLRELFVVALIYLARPFLFRMAGWLGKPYLFSQGT